MDFEVLIFASTHCPHVVSAFSKAIMRSMSFRVLFPIFIKSHLKLYHHMQINNAAIILILSKIIIKKNPHFSYKKILF